MLGYDFRHASGAFADRVRLGENSGLRGVCDMYRIEEPTADGRTVTATLIEPYGARPAELRVLIRPSESNPTGLWSEQIGDNVNFDTLQVYGKDGWTPLDISPASERQYADCLMRCLHDLPRPSSQLPLAA